MFSWCNTFIYFLDFMYTEQALEGIAVNYPLNVLSFEVISVILLNMLLSSEYY